MDMPPEFIDIAQTFHQDTELLFDTLDDAIKSSISELSKEGKIVAKKFLDYLLNGQLNDVQLARIWNSTPAMSGGFGFFEEEGNGVRILLTKILEALEQEIPNAPDINYPTGS